MVVEADHEEPHENQLSEVEIEELLVDQGALIKYQEGIDFFYEHLVHLNINIYIIEKLVNFPFDLFMPKSDFFWTIFVNTSQMSLLLISKMMNDSGNDAFVLRHFKNEVFKWVKPEYQDGFRDLLKKGRIDKETNELLTRIRNARDAGIAHFLKVKMDDAEYVQASGVNLEELKKVRDSIWNLFKALIFNKGSYVPLPESYVMEEFSKKTGGPFVVYSDVESVLNMVVRQSQLFNEPEDNPELWIIRKKQLTSEQLEIINQYRVKFGLPEA